jgi:hypothetical protein
MKNYFEFELNGKIAKAYKTLENLYEIENNGVNLAQVFLDIANGKILSFGVARNILNLAIKADINDFKERTQFVNDYFDKKRFKACDNVSLFVLELVKTPANDDIDGESEKK